jgi:hypothetical protein
MGVLHLLYTGELRDLQARWLAAKRTAKSLTMVTEKGLARERHGREPNRDEIEEETRTCVGHSEDGFEF